MIYFEYTIYDVTNKNKHEGVYKCTHMIIPFSQVDVSPKGPIKGNRIKRYLAIFGENL